MDINMDMSSPVTSRSMDMGSNSCKLSMLLNWHTIDTCFLASSFHIHTPAGFFLACLLSFLLVISLEFLRRLQRTYDRHLVSKHSSPAQTWLEIDDMSEELLDKQSPNITESKRARFMPSTVVVLEQMARGAIHVLQFAASYVVMLLVMYSNGYIILSILVGAFVGFTMFTRDMIGSKGSVNR